MTGDLFIAPPASGEEIDAIAVALREALGVHQPYLPIMHLLEHTLPTSMDGYELQIWPIAEMDGDEGRTWPALKRIALREDVYLGAIKGRPRDRFTAVHELSHLILHQTPMLSRRSLGASCKAERDPEWQADRLAAAMLMPACDLRKTATLDEAIHKFGVSVREAQKRAKTLNMNWRKRGK